MNASRFDRILRQVVFVPLLVLLFGASVLLWQMHAANATVEQIEGGDLRIEQTNLIERLIIDQETGLRGFETTHNPSFLEPYNAAEAELPGAFDRRRELARTAERRLAVDNLRTAYDTWHLSFATPLIATIEAGGDTSDVELNLQGKRQMDDIRLRIANIDEQTRNRRQEYSEHWARQDRVLRYGLLLVSIVLGLVLGLYIRKLLQAVSAAFRRSHDNLRMRADETFRSEQRLRTTLQSIGDGVVTCDPEGRVDSMNTVAEELTGWTAQTARNKPLAEVFRIVNESTREPVEDPVAKVLRLNGVVALANHTVLLRADGSEISIEDSAAPIRDKYGAIMGIVLVFRDVTVARKSQEALLANEKLAVAGRLAATIAHEIHNPLDSISNLLFLMDGQCTADEHAQFLELARQEIARVTQISRAMLSLYRESKAPIAIDLKEMLESILLLMDRRLQSLGVEAEAELPEGLVIYGFPAELRQVFTNLLTNAAEASGPPDPERPHIVRVTAEACPSCTGLNGLRRETGALVQIRDSGAGIAEHIQPNLFKPFFTTKGERGTGLGLWVSRGIITKHGGALELVSSTDAENHGTTVEVFLATNPVIHPAGD